MAYREPASHKTLTTLLKLAGGDALQLSQGGDTAERHDVPEIPADYADIISHRSAALIAAYSTNQASTEFVKSARFKMLTPPYARREELQPSRHATAASGRSA